MTIDLQASDLRTFIPARDFELSKRFYTAIGCRLHWADAHLALLSLGGVSFYLQNYHVQAWAENCMLHLTVRDARGCFDQLSSLFETGEFPGARVAPPKPEPYGALVTHVWDPSGVLLHLAQWLDPQAQEAPNP